MVTHASRLCAACYLAGGGSFTIYCHGIGVPAAAIGLARVAEIRRRLAKAGLLDDDERCPSAGEGRRGTHTPQAPARAGVEARAGDARMVDARTANPLPPPPRPARSGVGAEGVGHPLE